MRMAVLKSALACGLVLLGSMDARAAVSCTISGFEVEAYDHGGTYLHGTVNGGVHVSFMAICGVNSTGVQDCSSKATDRRLALALAARAQGQSLVAYFTMLNSCSEVQPYVTIAGLRTVQ